VISCLHNGPSNRQSPGDYCIDQRGAKLFCWTLTPYGTAARHTQERKTADHFSRSWSAYSFGWWLMLICSAGGLLVAGLFWEKSTADWWLISQTNRAGIHGRAVSSISHWRNLSPGLALLKMNKRIEWRWSRTAQFGGVPASKKKKRINGVNRMREIQVAIRWGTRESKRLCFVGQVHSTFHYSLVTANHNTTTFLQSTIIICICSFSN
jgi:hypothetical protein